MAVQAIPPGHHTVSPSLAFRDCAKAMDFYRKALGAEELMRSPGPGGKIMHAEMKIGSSIIMLAEEGPDMGCKSAETLGGSPVAFYLYFENVESAWKRATEGTGVKILYPLGEMFWGDKSGGFVDPFGYKWNLAQHTRDVTPEEMKKGQEEFFKQMAGKKPG
jgi:PhnB protein